MVLKDSKWDKKAKKNYQRKHGLTQSRRPETYQRPKWSSKKRDSNGRAGHFEFEKSESDEWDSEEDEEFLNHFYPQLSEQSLGTEQKLKIRNQLLQQLKAELSGQQDGDDSAEQSQEEPDGIYLGEHKPDNTRCTTEGGSILDNVFPKENESILLRTRPSKNKSVPKSKLSDNFLEEYGLESYADTVKPESDVSASKPITATELSLRKIANSSLDGFEIGKGALHLGPQPESKKSSIHELSSEEKAAREERARKYEENKLHNKIRSGLVTQRSKRPVKVLEINNFNSSDEAQMHILNRRILADSKKDEDTNEEDDLDYLLGASTTEKPKISDTKEPQGTGQFDIDSLLSKLDIKEEGTDKSTEPKQHDEPTQPSITVPLEEQDFLDSLLG